MRLVPKRGGSPTDFMQFHGRGRKSADVSGVFPSASSMSDSCSVSSHIAFSGGKARSLLVGEKKICRKQSENLKKDVRHLWHGEIACKIAREALYFGAARRFPHLATPAPTYGRNSGTGNIKYDEMFTSVTATVGRIHAIWFLFYFFVSTFSPWLLVALFISLFLTARKRDFQQADSFRKYDLKEVTGIT